MYIDVHELAHRIALGRILIRSASEQSVNYSFFSARPPAMMVSEAQCNGDMLPVSSTINLSKMKICVTNTRNHPRHNAVPTSQNAKYKHSCGWKKETVVMDQMIRSRPSGISSIIPHIRSLPQRPPKLRERVAWKLRHLHSRHEEEFGSLVDGGRYDG